MNQLQVEFFVSFQDRSCLDALKTSMSKSIPEITIREATIRDADAVVKCLFDAFEECRESYTLEGFNDTVLTPQNAELRFREMTVLVAENESAEMVGTVSFQINRSAEGHLRGMAVVPEYQGKGVAEKLLFAAETELRGRGCTRVSLDTTRPLIRAVGFYTRHGYRPTGAVGDFF